MRKAFRLSIVLAVLPILVITGCSKDSSDPADAFVGTYNYTMTAPSMGTQTGVLTVTKTSANKISMLTEGTPTPYTVSGNNITEDAQNVEIPVSSTNTAIFIETSTGTLSGKVITINGSWTNPQYPTMTFTVVATKN